MGKLRFLVPFHGRFSLDSILISTLGLVSYRWFGIHSLRPYSLFPGEK